MIHYVSIPTRTPSSHPDLDAIEHRYLHHFRTRTALELAGVHNPEFWLRYASHVALSEPAIKHAAIALSALHQSFAESRNMVPFGADMTYPLRQYTKAISTLTESIGTASWEFPDTPLIACILFCAFESMSYHLDSAISHASSGLKILAGRQQTVNWQSNKSVPFKLLFPLYTRLDTQKLELVGTSFLGQRQLQSTQGMNLGGFDDIDGAQRIFDGLTNAILHEMHEIDRQGPQVQQQTNDSYSIRFQALVGRYRTWCDGFDEFVRRGVAEDHIAACVLLQVWRILININLQVDLREGEMDFDRFLVDFEAIVDLASEFVLLRGTNPAAQEPADHTTSMSMNHEPHLLRHWIPNADGLRGGYLGIHPRSTPFVVYGRADTDKLHAATKALIETSRLARNTLPAGTGDMREPFENLPDQRPTFSFSPGIVSPLYVTISRCRDPAVRRKALLLMQRCKRREGLWDSALAARLGERVIEIEEFRARELNSDLVESSAASADDSVITSASQVPNEARVRMIKPTFLPDRRSIERYYLGSPGKLDDAEHLGETWIEEIMEW